jgi:transposase
VVDSTGTAIDRFTVPHTDTGLAELTRHLAQAGCAEVAIERPDGPVVAELLEVPQREPRRGDDRGVTRTCS